MSRPAKLIRPEWDASSPVSWPINVVLPAPLGPMMACSSPGGIASVTSSEAMTPPKRLVSPSIASSGSGMARPQQADDAAACEQHDQQQQRTEDNLPVLGDAGERLLQNKQHDCADQRAEGRTHAAQHHHHDQVARACPMHHCGADEI